MNNLLDLNLQFFAEEGGVEAQEVADPVTTDAPEDSSTSTEAEGTTEEASNVQSDEDNAKFAAARRRAEAEFNQRMQAIDDEYARRFEGYKNPITNQPIRSQKDYLDALDAQEKLERDQELQSKGIDPKMFEDMVDRRVNNNPYVQQAQQIIQQNQRTQLENDFIENVKQISLLNPNIKTVEDFLKDPTAQKTLDMVVNSEGKLSILDAYKLNNFDALMAGKVAGAKQAALNNINGTAHLNQTDNITTADNGEVEIPQSELAAWKRAFPHATHAELRKKYNSTL